MDDDLTLAIQLVLGEDPENDAIFLKAMKRLNAVAEAEGVKSAKSRAKAEGEAFRKEQTTQSAEAHKERRRAATAEQRAILKSMDEAFRAQRQAQATADRMALQQDAAAARTRANTQVGNQRKRLQDRKTADEKELQAQRTADAKALAEFEAAERKRATTQEGGWKKRLLQLTNHFRTEEQVRAAANRTRAINEERAAKASLQMQRNADRQAALATDDALKRRRRRETTTDSRGSEAIRQQNKLELTARRQGNSLQLIEQRKAASIELAETKAHQARIRDVTRFFLRNLSDTYRTGMRFVSSTLRTTYETGLRSIAATWRAHLDRDTAAIQNAQNRQNTAVRLGLDKQNATYSRAARERLALIERNATRETRVISGNAVQQANAIQRATAVTSTGVIGAATGRSRAGGAVVGALAGFGGFQAIKGVIEAASDLNESKGKFMIVFRQLSQESLNTLREWASKAAETLGLSEQQALEALGTFGNLFSGMKVAPQLNADMSKSLVQLSADLGSFNNVDPSEVLENLRAGVVGEAEPLRKFGIMLSETRIKAEALRLGLAKGVVDDNKVAGANLRIEAAIVARNKAIEKFGASSLQARTASQKLTDAQNASTKALGGSEAKLTAAQKAQAAYSIIMQDSALAQGNFALTADDLANRTRTSTARWAEHKAMLGGFILPLYLNVSTAVSDLITNLVKGDGVWKVVREGLTGIAAALAAILLVKGAVQVFSLLGTGLSLIAANPLIALTAGLAGLSVVLFNIVRNIGPIRDFWDALYEGTKNWITVGYRIGEPIKGLSKIVEIQSTIGAKARTFVDFFRGLVDGFKNWGKVGYLIDGPVAGLSAIVLIQSSLGAAARIIVDHVKSVIDILKDLFAGEDLDSVRKRLGLVFDSLPIALGKLVEPVKDAIGEIYTAARKAVTDRFGGLFTGAISFVRAGGAGAIRDVIVASVALAVTQAREMIGDFFGNLFSGGKRKGLLTSSGVGERNAAEDSSIAATLGRRINNIIANVGGGGGDFFGALFKGSAAANPDDRSLATRLGIRLREIVANGIKAIGGGFSFIGSLFGKATERTKPIREWLGEMQSEIGKFVSESVIPKLIDFPRVIGRFLSRTLFSEQSLAVLTRGTAIIAGIAAGIAIQFVRGFAEGIYQRRAEIGDVIGDVLSFAVKTVLGSGNPLVVLGGALVAIFAGTKILGAIGKFAGAVGQAKTNISGGIAALNGEFAKSQGIIKKAKDEKEAFNSTGFGKNIPQQAANLRSSIDKVRLSAMSLKDSFVKASTEGLSGKNLENAMAQNERVVRNREKTMLAGAATAAAAFEGYWIGAAETTQQKAAGIVTSIGTIGAAFGVGGPIAGAAAIVATGIGIVFGAMKKKADEAKRDLATTGELVANLSGSFKESFRETGQINRYKSALNVLRKELDNTESAGSKFFRRYKADYVDAAKAMSSGEEALGRYITVLSRARTNEIFDGNVQSIRTFREEILAAADAVGDARFDTLINGAVTVSDMGEGEGLPAVLNDLAKQFVDGKIDAEGFAEGLKAVGLSGVEVTEIMGDLENAVKTRLTTLAERNFGKAVSPALKRAIEEYQAQVALQGLIDESNDRSASPTDRLADAYERLRVKIDEATSAYRTYLDLSDGGKTNLAETRIGIAGQVDEVINLGGETTSDEQLVARSQNAQTFAEAIGQIARDANGNLDVFNAKLEEYRRKLKEQILPDLIAQNETLGDSKVPVDELFASVDAYVAELTTVPTRLSTELVFQASVDKPSLTGVAGDIQAFFAGLNLNQKISKFLFNGGTSEIPTIPRNASGGFIKKRMLSWVGEEGPELILPLTQPKRTRELLEQADLIPKSGVSEDQRGWNWRTMGNGKAGADVAANFRNGLMGDWNQNGSISDREWGQWQAAPNFNQPRLPDLRMAKAGGGGMIQAEDGSWVNPSYYSGRPTNQAEPNPTRKNILAEIAMTISADSETRKMFETFRNATADQKAELLAAQKAINDSLTGIVMLSKAVPATRKFFEMMKGQTAEVFAYMDAVVKGVIKAGERSRWWGNPNGGLTMTGQTLGDLGGVKNIPDTRSPIALLGPATGGARISSRDLEKMAAPAPRSAYADSDAKVEKIAEQVARLAYAVETGRDAPMIGELNITEAGSGRETANETITRLRAVRFLGSSPVGKIGR